MGYSEDADVKPPKDSKSPGEAVPLYAAISRIASDPSGHFLYGRSPVSELEMETSSERTHDDMDVIWTNWGTISPRDKRLVVLVESAGTGSSRSYRKGDEHVDVRKDPTFLRGASGCNHCSILTFLHLCTGAL